MNPLRNKSWSPWLVGVGIGVLSWFSFATVDKAIGITTAFEYTAALATKSVAPAVADSNPYYSAPEKDPKIDWEWMLVVGVFLGAVASSRLSGDRPRVAVPRLWAERFGSSPRTRFIGAFVGGALLMVGARLAGGCTSGHGISGALQLAVSSWVFLMTIFASGIAAAAVLYRRGGTTDV